MRLAGAALAEAVAAPALTRALEYLAVDCTVDTIAEISRELNVPLSSRAASRLLLRLPLRP